MMENLYDLFIVESNITNEIIQKIYTNWNSTPYFLKPRLSELNYIFSELYKINIKDNDIGTLKNQIQL